MTPKRAPTLKEIDDIEKFRIFLGEDACGVKEAEQKIILDLLEEVRTLKKPRRQRGVLEGRTEWRMWSNTLGSIA